MAAASMRASTCPARTGCPFSAKTPCTTPLISAFTRASRSAARLPESAGPVAISSATTTYTFSGPTVTAASASLGCSAASPSRPQAASTRASASAPATRFVSIITPPPG